MEKVVIVGASGYSGEELVRLLSRHPNVELVAVTSRLARRILTARTFIARMLPMETVMSTMHIMTSTSVKAGLQTGFPHDLDKCRRTMMADAGFANGQSLQHPHTNKQITCRRCQNPERLLAAWHFISPRRRCVGSQPPTNHGWFARQPGPANFVWTSWISEGARQASPFR